MCGFDVGDTVVAVDDGGEDKELPSPSLEVGRIYTVAWIGDVRTDCPACPDCGGHLGMDVVEIQNNEHWYCPCSFRKTIDLTSWLSAANTIENPNPIKRKERAQ